MYSVAKQQKPDRQEKRHIGRTGARSSYLLTLSPHPPFSPPQPSYCYS
ncbi:hypothetical protein NIES2104_39320 [Leptolyngbya sp. NIES-2104]|nr:hypothetical protein NIES2104_39320 [Leptolyngbya sp. NIES-2104]